MKVSIPDLLEQWHKLVEYAKKAFSFAGVSYLVTGVKSLLHQDVKVRAMYY